jgi:preprotein translocase subunit SecE
MGFLFGMAQQRPAKSNRPHAPKRFRLKFKQPKFLHAPKYFSESFAELRKVTWPTRKESVRLTVAVFLFSTVLTLLTVLVDYVFNLLAERLF